jgi:hypothetical protein
VKGGGQPSAALTVGSRAVGKRKTLDDILRPNRTIVCAVRLRLDLDASAGRLQDCVEATILVG